MILFALIFLAMLLFFPGVAMAGSQYGAGLWLSQLLPTLLPFFIAIRLFDACLPRVSGSRAFLLTGLLCGYPAGAALVTAQYDRGLLTKTQAYFYLGFVNNPSPMFVLVFCGGTVLSLTQRASAVLLMILLVSSFLGSLFFRLVYGFSRHFFPEKKISPRPTPPGPVPEERKSFSALLDKIILDSFILLAKIGGYVIIFSILGEFIAMLFAESEITALLCSGSLEITSGISYLQSASLSLYEKKVLTMTMLAFGGLSAAAQTGSILSKSELSIFPYVLCKGMCSGFACLLSILLFHWL